ncbi:MAG: DMT family transporter [Hyphomicrobiales bacterium]
MSHTSWLGDKKCVLASPWTIKLSRVVPDRRLLSASKNRYLLFGLLAAFCWGTHSVIVRYLTSDLHGIPIAALRLVIAAVTLFIILRAMKVKISINLRDWTLRIAVLSTVVNYIFFHIGLEHTGASNAMMLENTAPFFVLIFLVIFAKQHLMLKDVFATGIALVGVFLTVAHDIQIGGEGFYGDTLELVAGVSWAGFMIASSQAMRATNTTGERLNFLFGVFTCSAVLLLPLCLFFEIDPTLNDVFFLFLLGMVPTALAYYLWYEAASQLPTITASLMFTLSVVFTFINAALFLGEEITLNTALGAALIVAGIAITSLGNKPKVN